MNTLALLLSLTSIASAWEHVSTDPTATPGSIRGLISTPMGDRDVAIALGDEASWIIDPLHGEVVRTLDRGAHDAVLADLDGDARLELIGCGDQGLWAVPWTGRYGGTSVSLDDRPCAAIASVSSGENAGIFAAGPGWVSHFAASDGALTATDLASALTVAEGVPLLAAFGDQVAYAVSGGDRIQELSPAGVSLFPAAGPISDLAWSRRGWTWTLPDRFAIADSTNESTPLPDARLLVPIDEDRLLVVGDGVSTWLRDDTVEAFSTPVGVQFATYGDVNGDGCADLLLATTTEITALTDTCAADVPVDPEDAEEISAGPRLRPVTHDRHRLVLGVEVPSFLGDEMAGPGERDRGQQYVVVGSGWAMGKTLGGVEVQIPFFPALALGYEVGGRRVRAFFGVDSAALFFWIRTDGRSGIHLINGTAGLTVGSPRLRAGPFVTGGIYNYGGGLRTVLTPWIAGDAYKGIEARLTAFGPSTGEVMILYVWSQRLRRRHPLPPRQPPTTDDSAVDELPKLTPRKVTADPPGRSSFPVCGAFRVGAGAAVSMSSTQYSWTFVGSSAPISVGGSPAISLACETGKPGLGVLIGMETAPFLRYLGRYIDRAGAPQDVALNKYGTLTLGVDVGAPSFRLGVIGTAGVWQLGVGARAVVGLHTDRQGLRHHVELRGMGLYKGAPAAEVMLMYGFTWDPWKKPEFRDEDR